MNGQDDQEEAMREVLHGCKIQILRRFWESPYKYRR